MRSLKTPAAPAGSIQALLHRGLAFQQQRRFTEAESCYQSILRQHPDHPEANNLMGMLFAQAKQPGLAIDHFKQAVAGDPKNPVYRNNLGNAYPAADR